MRAGSLLTDDENHRRAYHKTYEFQREQLRSARDAGSGLRIYMDHRAYVARDLSDSQLEAIAWREAERSMNRAAWERTYADAEMRRRKGEAC